MMFEALLMATVPVWWPLLSIAAAVGVVAVIERRDHRRRAVKRADRGSST